MTVYNFGAGPAMLPLPVRDRIKAEWSDWQGLGVSVTEVGHRTKAFQELLKKAEHDLRTLLAIPDNYKVLFLQGGGQGQFALAPMNLLGKNLQADYLIYGLWSEKAYQEAQRYGQIRPIQIASETVPYTLSAEKDWHLNNKVG